MDNILKLLPLLSALRAIIMTLSPLWISAGAIFSSCSTIVSPTVLEATIDDMFGSVLSKLSDLSERSELLQETVEKAVISDAKTENHVVPLSAPVITVSSVRNI